MYNATKDWVPDKIKLKFREISFTSASFISFFNFYKYDMKKKGMAQIMQFLLFRMLPLSTIAIPVPSQFISPGYFSRDWRNSIQYCTYYSTTESQLCTILHRWHSSSYSHRIIHSVRSNKNQTMCRIIISQGGIMKTKNTIFSL